MDIGGKNLAAARAEGPRHESVQLLQAHGMQAVAAWSETGRRVGEMVDTNHTGFCAHGHALMWCREPPGPERNACTRVTPAAPVCELTRWSAIGTELTNSTKIESMIA